MRSKFLILLLCCLMICAAAADNQAVGGTFTGTGKRKPKFLGLIPYGSHVVEQEIEPGDSIGSLLKCMDKVHKRGGGTCAAALGSIQPGKPDQNLVYRKYEDVIVVLK